MLKSEVIGREFLMEPVPPWPYKPRASCCLLQNGHPGPSSFVDEGARVLDVLQDRACVNTPFLALFTYGRDIAGRPIRPAAPDQGKQAHDLNFHGSKLATSYPQSRIVGDTEAIQKR